MKLDNMSLLCTYDMELIEKEMKGRLEYRVLSKDTRDFLIATRYQYQYVRLLRLLTKRWLATLRSMFGSTLMTLMS